MSRLSLSVFGGSAAALMLIGGPALAQPRPPQDARGFQRQMWMMQNAARPSSPPARVAAPPARYAPAPAATTFSITVPRTWTGPTTVYVRGADGVLRPVAGGGPIVVRSGETVTLQPAPAPTAVTTDPPTNPDPVTNPNSGGAGPRR